MRFFPDLFVKHLWPHRTAVHEPADRSAQRCPRTLHNGRSSTEHLNQRDLSRLKIP